MKVFNLLYRHETQNQGQGRQTFHLFRNFTLNTLAQVSSQKCFVFLHFHWDKLHWLRLTFAKTFVT